MTNTPRRQDKVWVERRIAQGKQPNGYIKYIDWDSQEVLVKFHVDGDIEEFTLDEFWGNFTDAYGGTWMLRGGDY